MTDPNRLAEIKRGYFLFSKRVKLDSQPSNLYITPGLATKSLYMKFTPLYGSPVSPNNPFCTEAKFELVGEPKIESGQSIEIPKTNNHQQVGHGEVGESTGNESKSEPETDAQISMQELLEKMKRPVMDVKVAKFKKRKSDEVVVKSESAPSKKLKKVFTWF